MKRWVGIAGWVVAVAMVGAIFLVSQLDQRQVKQAEVRAAEAEEGLAVLREAAGELETERTRLEKDLATAQERIASLEANLDTARQETDREAAASKVAETVVESPEDAEDSEAELPDYSHIAMEVRENGLARTQAAAAVGVAYGDFLNALGLDKAERERVRDLLVDSQLEQIALQRFALEKGDVSAKDVHLWLEEEKARLQESLSTVIPEEDVALWQEYEATSLERTLDQSFDMQLNMYASGLTAENRELVRQIAVEEIAAHLRAYEVSDETFTATGTFAPQRVAMNAARDRLAQLLEDDQLAEVDNWFEIGNQALTAMEQQEGGGDEDDGETP